MPMSTSPSVPPRPGATLVGALPELERLIEQMSKALVPAMSRSHEARDDHGTGDGYAEAMWMLIKSLTFAVQAARAGHTGNAAAVHEALSEVDGCSRTAAGHTRDVRAAAAGPAGLAALDTPSTETRWALGDAAVHQMTAHVSAYFEDTGTLIEDDLEVTLTDDDAQPAVTWTGRRGPLALDGRAHLDLTAAAQIIAATYDRYPRDTAIQDALQIGQDDTR
jgi:hypothetical protein